MKILVFDTETSGLPTERNASIRSTEKWPHILQFSYILYDIQSSNILDLMNEYIKIADDVEISEKSIEIHEITRETCQNKGVSIDHALNRFNKAMANADLIVAHNLEFDKNLVLVESIRNNIEQQFTVDGQEKHEYCTMKNNIDRCKIERISKTGKPYYKYPTLSELYQHLFHITPNATHNSIVDVLICLRIFVLIYTEHDVLSRESISNLFWKYRINSGAKRNRESEESENQIVK